VRRLAALVLVAIAAGCGTGSDRPEVDVSVQIPDKNGSGIYGSADVTRMSDTVSKVDVSLSGALPEGEVPAYVISGGCSSFEPRVEAELEPVLGGRSSTDVEIPIADITTGSYAVAVGSTDPMRYVACGDLIP
jgi:hypothetical protein